MQKVVVFSLSRLGSSKEYRDATGFQQIGYGLCIQQVELCFDVKGASRGIL
jgi:hypothetical protein